MPAGTHEALERLASREVTRRPIIETLKANGLDLRAPDEMASFEANFGGV
jgi:hypothetical protein